MINLMQFDRGCQSRVKLAGYRDVGLTVMCNAGFNPVGRDLVVKVKEYDMTSEFRKHLAVYVYKRKSGRVVWGVHVIEESLTGESMVCQVVLGLCYAVRTLIEQGREFDLALVSDFVRVCLNRMMEDGNHGTN
jgi:hypothetical protein